MTWDMGEVATNWPMPWPWPWGPRPWFMDAEGGDHPKMMTLYDFSILKSPWNPIQWPLISKVFSLNCPVITVKSQQITMNIPWKMSWSKNEELVGSTTNTLRGEMWWSSSLLERPRCVSWDKAILPPGNQNLHGWSLIVRSPKMASLSLSRSTWSLCLRWEF